MKVTGNFFFEISRIVIVCNITPFEIRNLQIKLIILPFTETQLEIDVSSIINSYHRDKLE